jgi:DNA invertase Pin-like site-specific DNA recombinase
MWLMKDRNEQYVGCYVRVSSTAQEKGRESQIHALKAYCRNHGYQPQWYVDTISGAADKRPAFDKLQHDIFHGKIGTVLVWRLDRLTRKGIKEGLAILQGWFERHIRVVSVTEDLDFSGPIGEIIASLLFALARMQRQALIENTVRGLASAKARGVKLGKHARIFAKDIVPLLDKGQSVMQVAQSLNVTRQAVYMCLWRSGTVRSKTRSKRK